MSLELFLYLVSVLANISCVASLTAIISLFFLFGVGIFSVIVWDTESRSGFEEFKPKRNKIANNLLMITLIFTSLSVFIPSKKTMYAIGFSYYTKQTEIPKKLMDLLNQKLDDALGGEKT